MMKRWGLFSASALALAGLCVSGCEAEEGTDGDDRISNGFAADIDGVGQVLAYSSQLGWVPACTATVYRGNTLVSVEHCGVELAGLPLAFTTDLELPRDAFGIWDLTDPDVRNNGLGDAREIVGIRVIEHPVLDNAAYDTVPFTEGVALFRVDEPYSNLSWWNILPNAFLAQTIVVGYGNDPFDPSFPELQNDPEHILSSGLQRAGIMEIVDTWFSAPGAAPPLAVLARTGFDQSSCHGDSGGPGFQNNAITTVVSGAPIDTECYEDSPTLSVLVGEYRGRIDGVVAEWNDCLLAADYNGDGIVNGADNAIWSANYGCTSCRPSQGDANGDNRVNGADFLRWQSSHGQTCEPPPAAALACELSADFNGDGVVDMADVHVLIVSWGQCSGGCVHSQGDANGDGAVDGIDVGILSGQWGQSC